MNYGNYGFPRFNPQDLGEEVDSNSVELYKNYKLNENISLTPGVFVLFNPEGNKNNDTTTVGVLRTTFGF